VSLVDQFIRIARKYPSRLAIVDRATGSRVTYKMALVRALVLERKLRAYEPGLVGVMIPTSAGAILTVVAAIMSGRTPVMINYSTGAAQNCEMARRRLGFTTIITSRALLARVRCPELDGMVFVEDLAAGVTLLDRTAAFLRASLSSDRIAAGVHPKADTEHAVVLFTSGSEREPKAVPLTHRNLVANIDGIRQALSFTVDDVILGNLPLFHVFGFNTNLWLPLLTGMTVVTHPNPLEFKSICAAVLEEKITMMVGTPTFLWGYLQKAEAGDFASLRLIITGADRCPEPLRRGYWEKHNIALVEGYGTTETSPVISVNAPERNRPGSIGHVLNNLEVRIEHFETGDACGPNEIGKILVKGASVMNGYFDDFEATALRMRHGWYDTGDMGYLDADGYLWHSGRLGRFVKIGGEMVSLGQVQEVLERALPDGVSGAVVEVADLMRGSRIVGVVTEGIDERDTLRRMSGELPRIAVPHQFVIVPEMPRMPSGKIDFRSLTDIVRHMVHQA
jgi:acyl-[acyl-carrier-protein]-phospholipid O-acyltransferase / long-chain-fatty-acid--[acyl-carrier-protein] ligase